MSPARILGAAFFGGLAVFVWGAISHMLLPTGDLGVRSLPAEQALLPAMKTAITERGFYFFPGFEEEGPGLTDEEKKQKQEAWAEKYRQGPRGVLVFDPAGGQPMSATMLGVEFASNVLCALILTLVLVQTRAGRGMRVFLAAVLGIFAWASIDVSYWNWYRFPVGFAANQFIDQAVGWLVGGIVIALVLGRPKISPVPVPVSA